MKYPLLGHLVLALTALVAGLLSPKAQAAAGDLYVSDLDGGRILKFSPSGSQTVFATGLLGPEGLAFDKNGNLFVAEGDGRRISKITPNGTKTVFAATVGFGDGIAFDSAGNLFVAEIGNSADVVTKFTPLGTRSVFASGFDVPTGLAFDHFGNLYLANEGNNIVYRFTPSGMRSSFASNLNIPTGLAFDNSGNLFAVNHGSGGTDGNSIIKITQNGTRTTFVTGLNEPDALAIDQAGNLFVTNFPDNEIIKVTPNGVKSTFANSVYNPTFLAFEPAIEKVRSISTRGFVQTGENVLIAGFILGGNGVATNGVLVRAIGPSLSHSGIASPLQDPTLELHNSAGVLIASNNNWQDTQKAQIAATGAPPSDPRESAIYVTLPAGRFTAVVRGANNSSGVALVEVYSVR